MMSRCLAPRARRMPISRVRSVTVASMMFMMPMPPTNSEIEAIVPRMIAELPGRPPGLLQQFVGDGHLDVFLRMIGLVGTLTAPTVGVTSSIELTWTVSWVSWVPRRSTARSGKSRIRSPNRSRQVFSGM